VKWLVVSLFSLLLGFLLGKFKQDVLTNQISVMSLELQEAQTRNEILQTTVSRLQISAASETQSIKSLMHHNKQLQDELSAVNNKLFFYERVVAPELESAGVKIYSFEVTQNTHTKEWDYQLVLMQSQKERRLLKGKYAITLSVFEDEKLTQIALSELTQSSENTFKFKYFQTLQGAFTLPDGMTIDEVVIRLNVTGNRWYKAQSQEERYDWRVLTTKDIDNLSEFDNNESTQN